MNRKTVFSTLVLGAITAFSSTNAAAESQDLALDNEDYRILMLPTPAGVFASIQLVDSAGRRAGSWNLRVDSGKVFTCDLSANSVALESFRPDRLYATLIAAKAAKRQTLLTITDEDDNGNTSSGVCTVSKVGLY
ncbi:MAG: hypothetical protein ACSHXK_08225 [Oceanococcus sp.]